MSEGQQEAYQHDNQSSVDQQLASSSTEQQQLSHKRKREPIEEGSPAEIDDARPGSDRRSSIKHTSPNMSAFMPINTNSPQNPYASYQPLNALQQHSPNTMNGSSSASDAANTALAATAMSSMLPSLGGMPFPQSDAGRPAEQHNMDSSFTAMSPQPVEGHTEGVGGIVHPAPRQPVQQAAPTPNPKPQVGTEEWHRVRRDNHKEVERRRRETINEGINELAKIVPNCEKNKGSILQRAVQYIQQLKDSEAANIEKWTLEKLLTEQAIQELSARNEKLQKDLDRAWREAETWKKSCLGQADISRDNSGGQSQGGAGGSTS